MKKLQKFGLQMIAAIGVVIFIVLTYYSWAYTARMYTDDEALFVVRDNLVSMLLFLAGLLTMAGLVSKLAVKLTQRSIHVLAVIMSLCAVAGLFILIVSARAIPKGVDQQYMYLIALEMASGKFDGMKHTYFRVYPYQVSLVTLYSLLYRIVEGEGANVIQYVQAVCAGVSIYAGFRITRELFHSIRIECMYLLCVMGMLPLYLYVLFIYGETLGICGALISIWFYLMANRKEKQNKYVVCGYWLLSGLGLLLAYFARSSLIIVCIAMMIIQLLNFLMKKNWLGLIMPVILLMAVLARQKLLLHTVEEQANVDLGEGIPSVLGIAMGLQGDSDKGGRPGSENSYAWNLFQECEYDQEDSGRIAGDYIRNRLRSWSEDPKRMVIFFREKILNQWNEPSYGAFTMTRFMDEPEEWVEKMYYGKGNNLLYDFLDHYQAVMYLFLLGYFFALRKGSRLPVMYLPGLIIIGGFLFSVIWEAKSRYVFPFFVMAIPCAAYSIIWYYDRMVLLFKRGKNFLVHKSFKVRNV